MTDQEPEMIHRADADLAMATPKPEDDLRLLHTEAAEAELSTLRAQVERLTGAAEALGAMPGGYCFCSRNRIGDDSKTHEPECADLRAALTAGAAL